MNRPPEKPSNPFPEDRTENVEIENLTLKWNCSDPDKDHLKYNVFLGKDNSLDSLDLVIDDLKESLYKTEILENETNYYWKIIAFDGEFWNESEIWHFKTKPYFPDWWLIQDNPDYVFSFGTGKNESQIDSHYNAFEKAVDEKSKFIKKYLEMLLNNFVIEANVTDSLSLKMKEKLSEVISKKEYPDFFLSRQETIILHSGLYKTYVRIHIPKKAINKKLYEKIVLTKKLFKELQYSDSFQKFVKENADVE